MAVQSIFGNGGLRIKNASTDVTFPFAFNNIRFEKVNVRQTAITGKIHLTTLYFRPVIEALIVMCNQDDVQSLLQLNNILLLSVSNEFEVYPNYSTDNFNPNLSYKCFLDSDIEYLQIDSRVQVGQTITLRFIAKELETTLPTQWSLTQVTYYVKDDDLQYVLDDDHPYIQ